MNPATGLSPPVPGHTLRRGLPAPPPSGPCLLCLHPHPQAQQRDLTVRRVKETEKELGRQLQQQREHYEATVQRHLSFIDQVTPPGKRAPGPGRGTGLQTSSGPGETSTPTAFLAGCFPPFSGNGLCLPLWGRGVQRSVDSSKAHQPPQPCFPSLAWWTGHSRAGVTGRTRWWEAATGHTLWAVPMLSGLLSPGWRLPSVGLVGGQGSPGEGCRSSQPSWRSATPLPGPVLDKTAGL